MVKILQLPKDSRPREKLLQRGPQALSDAELLAIFLRVGVPGMNAVALSEYLLTHFGSLQGLLTASESEFCQIKGMGQAKFVQLQAAMEMTKRYLFESLEKGDALTCAEQSKTYVASVLRGRHREAFWVLFLNQQHQLIASEMLFEGTLNAASVYPREVVKRALDHHAAAVMLAHNHPSGHTDPSRADHQLTKLLVEALAWVEIRVLDHFIVGEGAVLSFAEHGWMPATPERIKKV